MGVADNIIKRGKKIREENEKNSIANQIIKGTYKPAKFDITPNLPITKTTKQTTTPTEGNKTFLQKAGSLVKNANSVYNQDLKNVSDVLNYAQNNNKTYQQLTNDYLQSKALTKKDADTLKSIANKGNISMSNNYQAPTNQSINAANISKKPWERTDNISPKKDIGEIVKENKQELERQQNYYNENIKDTDSYKDYFYRTDKINPTLEYAKNVAEVNEKGLTFKDKALAPLLSGMENIRNLGGDFKQENGTRVALPSLNDLKTQKAIEENDNWLYTGYANISESVGNMLPGIALSAIPAAGTALGTTYFGASTFGTARNQALLEGYDEKSATTYGIINSALELGVGKVLGGTSALLGKSPASKLLGEKLTSKIVSNPALNSAVSDMVSEFGEEYIQEWLDPKVQAYVLDHKDLAESWNSSSFFDKQNFYAGLLGAISAGITNTPNAIRQNTNINSEFENIVSTLQKDGNEKLTKEQLKQLKKTYYNEYNKALKNDTEIDYENISNKLTNENRTKQSLTNNIEQLKEQQRQTTDNKLKQELATKIGGLEQELNQFKIPMASTEGMSLMESASKYNIKPETQSAVQSLMENRGIESRWDATKFSDNSVNALWTKDTNGNRQVIFNPNASLDTIVEEVAVHELTHDILSSENTTLNAQEILDYVSQLDGYNEARQSLENTYSTMYDPNSADFKSLIDEEVVADVLGRKLGNQEFINQLVNSKPSIAKSIYNWVISKLNSIVNKGKVRSEKLYWQNIKNNFENAYKQEYKNNEMASTKYKVSDINTDNQGRTLSKQQQEYFKDSKVRDENGNLEVVYHGTPNDFTVFDISKSNNVALGNGLYFTNVESTADSYANNSETSGKIMEGYLDIKNPINNESKTISFEDFKNLYETLDSNKNLYDEEMGMSEIKTLLSDYGDVYNENIDSILKKYYDAYEDDVSLIDNLSYMSNVKELYETIRKTTGIDGIVIEHPSNFAPYEKYYIAFNSNQFKNIDNTNPTTNEDIRYSKQSEEWDKWNNRTIAPEGTKTKLKDIKLPKKEANLPKTKQVKQKTNLPMIKENDVLKADASEIANEINRASGKRGWIGTAAQSDVLKDTTLIKDLDTSKLSYVVESNQKSVDTANNHLDTYGYEKSLEDVQSMLRSDKLPKASDVALAERLLQEAIKNGDTKTAQDLIMDIAILGTDLGQATQALSMINRLTPEGQLKMYTKLVQRAKARGDKAYQDVEITTDMVQNVLDAYNSDGTYDQQDLNNRVENFKQEIAKQMKTTKMEKVNAWRYLAMLGNPKTHIRNIVSNVAMNGTIKVKNAMARTLESLLPVKNRTKTWKKSTDFIKNYAERTANEMKGIITGEDKYNEKSSLETKKQIFKNKGLEKLSNFNSNALEAEDWFFSKRAFKSNLEEYLTANGINTQADIENNPEVVKKAQNYAVEQAEIATFRQYSKLAAQINNLEKNNKLARFFIEATVPFKKTPINVAKAGVKYSPLGLIKSISYDIYQVKQGNMEASQFIDNLSQGLTGTSLAILGYVLAKNGILNGGGDDDKEGKYDSQLGDNQYSLKIGDKSYSISWLSPVAMPLLVGANAFEQLEEKEEWDMNVVSETLAKTLDPLNEMSFMQGLTNALSSYDSGVEKLAGIGESVAQNYVGQFFPTLLSQFAATIDDKKRSTKASADSSYKFGEQTLRSIMYKLPGLRQQLEVATDVWGNEKEQADNIIQRAYESFLAPYSTTKNITSDLDKEIKKIYNETGETKVIPGIPYSYVKYGDETYRMSANEYTKYKKTYGTTASSTLSSLIKSDSYKNASYEDKAKMIDNAYDYARAKANEEYFNNIPDVNYENKTLDKLNGLKSEFGINASTYYANKNEYDYAYQNPNKYKTIKQITSYDKYNQYKEKITTIKENTKNDKEEVIRYINSLNLSIPQKAMFIKQYYKSFNAYDGEIINYINSQKLSKSDKETILTQLGFTIRDGRVYN